MEATPSPYAKCWIAGAGSPTHFIGENRDSTTPYSAVSTPIPIGPSRMGYEVEDSVNVVVREFFESDLQAFRVWASRAKPFFGDTMANLQNALLSLRNSVRVCYEGGQETAVVNLFFQMAKDDVSQCIKLFDNLERETHHCLGTVQQHLFNSASIESRSNNQSAHMFYEGLQTNLTDLQKTVGLGEDEPPLLRDLGKRVDLLDRRARSYLLGTMGITRHSLVPLTDKEIKVLVEAQKDKESSGAVADAGMKVMEACARNTKSAFGALRRDFKTGFAQLAVLCGQGRKCCQVLLETPETMSADEFKRRQAAVD